MIKKQSGINDKGAKIRAVRRKSRANASAARKTILKIISSEEPPDPLEIIDSSDAHEKPAADEASSGSENSSCASKKAEEDIGLIVNDSEKEISDPSVPADEVSNIIKEIDKELREKNGSREYSSTEIPTDYSSYDPAQDIVQPVSELPPVEEDFAVHKLRKDTDLKEYTEGRKYYSPWNNPFFEYLKENIINRPKRANLLALRKIKSSAKSIISWHQQLYNKIYSKK